MMINFNPVRNFQSKLNVQKTNNQSNKPVKNNLAPLKADTVSFKGLWEAKETGYNYGGMKHVFDITYIYHPFKDEKITKEKEESLKNQVPENLDYYEPGAIIGNYYFNDFKIGYRLDITEKEYKSNRENILKSLPKTFAETPKDLPEEKLFNLGDVRDLLKDLMKSQEPEQISFDDLDE